MPGWDTVSSAVTPIIDTSLNASVGVLPLLQAIEDIFELRQPDRLAAKYVR